MSLKLIYIDDEPDLLEMFVDTFSAPDVEILTYTDAEEALAKIIAEPPDAVFLDYRLKTITGDQLAQKIPDSITKALITGELGLNPKSSIETIFYKPYKVEDVERFIDSVRQKKTRR